MAKRLGTWLWWQIFSVVVFLVFVCGAWVGYQVLTRISVNALAWSHAFATGAGRSPLSIFPEIGAGFSLGRERPIEEVRYLVLGKDEVVGSNRPLTLTDTIILVTYRPTAGIVRLLSFPRDIYLPEEGTKINALYTLGMNTNPDFPARYVEETLEKRFGVSIDGTLEISLAELEEIIDLVGGVEVEVPQAFTDTQFPRSGVDVTKERDPAKLYETVHFEAGRQTMSGAMAAKYVRSRHSDVAGEGNDGARNRRQQQVIEALVSKIADPSIIARPRFIGQLYGWYSQRYQSTVSLTQLGRLLGTLERVEKLPSIQKVQLPVTDLSRATDSATLFVHPPVSKYRQWAYESVDPSWNNVRLFMQEKGL